MFLGQGNDVSSVVFGAAGSTTPTGPGSTNLLDITQKFKARAAHFGPSPISYP